ncbi:MAG: transcription-repair coupling factor, partial [Planctomycetota bacterium]
TQQAITELVALEAPRVVVACHNDSERDRVAALINEHAAEGGGGARIDVRVASLHRGFICGEGDDAIALITSHELLNRAEARRSVTVATGRTGRAIDTFLDFDVGDTVVHAEHGIATFVGLTLMKPRELPGRSRDGRKKDERDPEEYLTLEFAGGSRLHVPAIQIDLVQRYVGGFRGKPPLSKLGGNRWKNQKAKATESVRDLAAELLRVRAAREAMPGIRFPEDTAWQHEFEAEFPYDETEDQLAALGQIKKDMTSARPMDRLVCGDVGFGKTELAIRAAFKACEFGKQVAVLVPTTVLAEQHERTFRARFADYPFRVESLSRFKTTKQLNETLRNVRKGHVDVIIGTHRLLSKDVRFSDLGLVVIDEEQRFGVEHKEKLLQLRLTVDVMTLSATPIPRTLNMAMMGLRDISSLTTAPLDRRAIVTEVTPYNTRRIKQAIDRELSRDGQVYFVHNRVHNIKSVADDVQRLAPDAKVVIGHGQMQPSELEEVMLKFIRREADILVSTTIIESGIDISTANTMIINDADRFGLAELHQLRGRVGRSHHRAYCYLLLPADRPVREIAQKRLRALEEYAMLGAGFKIAMRDLEIRGAGNILGDEQSGHIAAVGYDMFCRLLERAVHEFKNDETLEPPSSTSVEIGYSGYIPRAYIPSDRRRMDAYRRLATAASIDDLERAREDLTQAYGDVPSAMDRLFEIAEIRIGAAALAVRTIAIRDQDVVLRSSKPERVAAAFEGFAGTVRTLDAEHARAGDGLAEVYVRPPAEYREPGTLAALLRHRLRPKVAAG